MKQRPFDRAEHVYRNDAFAELVKDAVRFFNGTPVLTLPPPASFLGRGVYAIYYTGSNPFIHGMLNSTELLTSIRFMLAKLFRKAGDNHALPMIQRINQVSFSAACASITTV